MAIAGIERKSIATMYNRI